MLARQVEACVSVGDLEVATDMARHPELIVKKIGYGTKHFAHEPAMTLEHARRW